MKIDQIIRWTVDHGWESQPPGMLGDKAQLVLAFGSTGIIKDKDLLNETIRTENVNQDDASIHNEKLPRSRLVKISVSDTGIGMDETTLQKIFDPFFTTKGPRKNNFHILGARIWARFVRSGGGKTGGIASSFEDFATPGAGEDGLKPGWINGEIIFARALRKWAKALVWGWHPLTASSRIMAAVFRFRAGKATGQFL